MFFIFRFQGRWISSPEMKGRAYWQVAASVRDEAALERELRPLRELRDNYPKWIVTLDDDPPMDYDGIRQISAFDFFLGQQWN